MEFKIIGCGTGNDMLLTEEAKNAVLKCDKVFSTERISYMFKDIREDIITVTYAQLFNSAINCQENTVAILVSGDSGFFSAAKKLKLKLKDYGNVELICGISSMQYFCSKIGLSYDDCVFSSMHGRKNSILGFLSYNEKVFVLTGGNNCNCIDILNEINNAGMGFVYVYIGENLSSENENITEGLVSDMSGKTYSDLSVMIFINSKAVNKNLMFYDKDFIRDEIPMTKEEIRWVSVNKMNIKADFVCYDIGSGTGSVSLEMAKKAYRGVVFSVDKKAEAVSLLNKNIKKLGCYNVKAYEGDALSVIKDFPTPDVVFIGGGSGDMAEIINAIIEKNANVRIVVNAIAIETVSKTLECFNKLKIKNTEIIALNISKSKNVGSVTMMMANNPITIISGGGIDEA